MVQVASGFDLTHNLTVIEHNTRRAADGGIMGRGEGKPDQWKLLTQARAADSTSYVLECDQPDGSLLATLGPAEDILIGELGI